MSCRLTKPQKETLQSLVSLDRDLKANKSGNIWLKINHEGRRRVLFYLHEKGLVQIVNTEELSVSSSWAEVSVTPAGYKMCM